MVSESTINKYTNELLKLYIDLWSSKYQRPPEINRFKQKWGFRGMYEDLGIDQARKVITFYMNTGRVGHSVDHLLYNYERLNKIVNELEKDEEDRRLLRIETQKRVEEREARGNK